ncbi:MAG: cytochrome o ubiquinol oxidase subunit III [Candidatus Thiodiazotropha sp.]
MQATLSLNQSTHGEHGASTFDEARQLGFWFYLMSDAVIFALLFATYASMSHSFAGGPSGKTLFDIRFTLAETGLLLTSSLSCGLATLYALHHRRVQALGWLVVTLLLGLGFLTLEMMEFRDMIAQGAGPDRSGYLSAFFTLVGTHGLHVSMGLVWLITMVLQLMLKGTTAPVLSRLQRWSLFWHFLDIVWVSIFSFVYLPGVLS